MNAPTNKNIFQALKEYWFLVVALTALFVGAVELRFQVHTLEKRIERKEVEDSRKLAVEFARLSDQIQRMNEKLTVVAEDVARINGRLNVKD